MSQRFHIIHSSVRIHPSIHPSIHPLLVHLGREHGSGMTQIEEHVIFQIVFHGFSSSFPLSTEYSIYKFIVHYLKLGGSNTWFLNYSSLLISYYYFTQDFIGNTDWATVVYHDLEPPIRARYIRFRPVAWNGHISMRVEIYGCIKGNIKRPFQFHYELGIQRNFLALNLTLQQPRLGLKTPYYVTNTVHE